MNLSKLDQFISNFLKKNLLLVLSILILIITIGYALC